MYSYYECIMHYKLIFIVILNFVLVKLLSFHKMYLVCCVDDVTVFYNLKLPQTLISWTILHVATTAKIIPLALFRINMALAGLFLLACFGPESVSSVSVGVNSLEMENHLLSNKLQKLEEELYETKNFIKLMYMAVSLA